MNKYNLDKLIKVECHDFYPSKWYSYKKERKFLGIVWRKEGIYSNHWHDYLGFEVPEYRTLKNNLIYENPEVLLHYQGGYSKTYYFHSFIDAKKFADEITSVGRWQS